MFALAFGSFTTTATVARLLTSSPKYAPLLSVPAKLIDPCLDKLLEPGGTSDPLLESETIAARFGFLGFPKQHLNELIFHPMTYTMPLQF